MGRTHISIRLDDELEARVQALARIQRVSRSEIIRRALPEGLAATWDRVRGARDPSRL
jgi:predicted transcriptional regulator